MASQSLNSISFVISAVYTVTFANTIYLMTVKDPMIPFSLENMQWDYNSVICGVISLIMTLRFFFGNNQYISDVMDSDVKTPWIKFYHFMFIAIQSVVLLITSYSIPNKVDFISGITSIFIIELLWYIVTFFIDRKGVYPDDKKARNDLLIAEISNFGFIICVVVVTFFINTSSIWWLFLVFLAFIINTAIDLRKNMPIYMG